MSSLFRRSVAAVLSVGLAASQLIAPATAAGQAAVTISMPIMTQVPFSLYGQWNTQSNWHDSLDAVLTTMDDTTILVNPASLAAFAATYAPAYAAQIQAACASIQQAQATVQLDGVVAKGSVSSLSALVGESLDAVFDKLYGVDPNFDFQGLNLSADVEIAVKAVNQDITTQMMTVSGTATVAGTSFPLMYDESIYDVIAQKYQAVCKNAVVLREQKAAAANDAYQALLASGGASAAEQEALQETYKSAQGAVKILDAAIAKLTAWEPKMQACVERAHAYADRAFAFTGTFTASSGAAVVDQLLAKANQLIDENYDAVTGRVAGYPMLDAYVDKYGDRVLSLIPNTVAEVAASQKAQAMYNKFATTVQNLMPDGSVYDISMADLMSLLTDSYDAIAVVDDQWMTMTASIADAQNQAGELVALAATDPVIYAGLADVYQDLYGTALPEQAVFTSVTSHKKLVAEAGLNAQMQLEGGYHVTRVFDALEVELPETTTSTTSTSTSTSTSTTTTSTDTSTTTTTTSTDTSSTTTTTSTSTSTDTSSTTTTTSTDTSSTTTSTTTSTSSTTTDSGSSTTTTTTTTADSYVYRFVASESAAHSNGTYWSEDTTAIDLSDCSYFVDLYRGTLDADGVFQGEGVVQYGSMEALNGTLFSACSPSQIAYTTHGDYTFDICLTQEAVNQIQAFVMQQDSNWTADALAEAGLVVGNPIAQESVRLVKRGDINFDNVVDAKDATAALSWYVAYYVAKIPLDDAKPHFVEDVQYFDDAIYAGDVDSTQEVKLNDASYILDYYVTVVLTGQPLTWSDIIGSDVKSTWH